MTKAQKTKIARKLGYEANYSGKLRKFYFRKVAEVKKSNLMELINARYPAGELNGG